MERLIARLEFLLDKRERAQQLLEGKGGVSLEEVASASAF
jgi:hypothetical protein